MTIYNPKLFIGRDDVLDDTETDLYYMHARYYDPGTEWYNNLINRVFIDQNIKKFIIKQRQVINF